ncbi:MAG: hypothetical protein WDM96_13520 [Lacunisphaera sp.]
MRSNIPMAPLTIDRIVSIAATPKPMPATPIRARNRCRRRLVNTSARKRMPAQCAPVPSEQERGYSRRVAQFIPVIAPRAERAAAIRLDCFAVRQTTARNDK